MKKVYSSCKEIPLRNACETHAKYAPNKGIRNVDYTMLLKMYKSILIFLQSVRYSVDT